MSEIILKQPVSILNRKVKFDIKDFFIQISKTAVQATAQGLTGNLIGSTATIVNGVFDISKATELDLKAEELAWLLIARSLTQAITEMLTSDQDLFGSNVYEAEVVSVAAKIENKINESEIAIDNDFFEVPHHLALLDDLEIVLIEWFQQLGLDEAKAKATYKRLKGQFSFPLDKEWATNASQYTSIIDQLNTPFTKATVKQRNIRQYRSWLQQQVNERMFDEAFGLKQIYVPLRAYYMKSEDQDEKIINQDQIEPLDIKIHKNMNKIVCDLESEIREWLEGYNEHDALRVISGGPGSGKSSFAKMLAANLSAQSNIPILFIPLHHFHLSDYLLEAIKKFVENQLVLSHTNMTEEKSLLLIFDGLDELSMQSGTNAAEVSNRFIIEVQDALRDRKNIHWKAIITGRELSIQSQQHKLKKPKTIYHLLPYYIDEENRENFNDANSLLMTDQRSEWWQKLAELKGFKFNDIPTELATKHLEPITTEPLLNYLVSLSYLKEDGIVFSEHTNLNEIYADLLDSVHERKYTDSGTHRSVDSIDKRKFIRILQEIALTVWHENGRTARVSQITEQCKRANIDSYFKEFTKDAESGVIRLLMAFYFRKFDGNNSDETFEFTHKSFGEYLAAKRIMLELSKMLNEVERFKEEVDSGWTLEVAFEKWISVCGPQRIDNYLRNFLAGEIQILASSEYGLSRISKYQELLIELIQMAVNSKSPIKKLSLSTFEEDLKFSQNSEIALIELHSLCAKYTNKVLSDTKNDSFKYFNSWINRIDYRHNANLNHLCIKATFFDSALFESDLHSAILDGTFFSAASFHRVNFTKTSLRGVDFYYGHIILGNLNDADLTGAVFYNTNLSGSSFEGAKLEGIELMSTNLTLTNFNNVEMSDATLSHANLDDSSFRSANLKNSSFNYVSINGTDFTDANLENANFEGVNHEKAIFTGANLKGTILENLYPSEEKSEDEK